MGSVIVCDFDGNMLSSVWQYGQMDWEVLYNCLNTVIVGDDDWAIFHYDEDAPEKKGAICPSNRNQYPTPGTYTLLTPDGAPISVSLVPLVARPRHPTVSNTQTRASAYRRRERERDPCCLISGSRVPGSNFSRFKAAHIFPCAHEADWIVKGYPSHITDPAPSNEVGGLSKIDSIQNLMLLRSDVHDAWDSYDLAVNPDQGYVIIPFVDGFEDVAGKVLKLDHIEDPNRRPLDELFHDHFLQCVMKNMKGAVEPTWDYEATFGEGAMDLSNQTVWGSKSGQAHFEFEVAHRLHSLQVEQEMGL